MTDLEFLHRFFRATDAFDGPEPDNFFWRTDGEYAPVTIIAICNDLFWWACADCERVTPENIHLLEQSVADIKPFVERWRNDKTNSTPMVMPSHAVLLFCARARKMRRKVPTTTRFHPALRSCSTRAGRSVGARTSQTRSVVSGRTGHASRAR